MDEFDKMIAEAKRFDKSYLDKKKNEIEKEMQDFEFKTLLDAVELLFELRAKREKSTKDKALIDIIENVLMEEPFEYKDEDYILASYSNVSSKTLKTKKRI